MLSESGVLHDYSGQAINVELIQNCLRDFLSTEILCARLIVRENRAREKMVSLDILGILFASE